MKLHDLLLSATLFTLLLTSCSSPAAVQATLTSPTPFSINTPSPTAVSPTIAPTPTETFTKHAEPTLTTQVVPTKTKNYVSTLAADRFLNGAIEGVPIPDEKLAKLALRDYLHADQSKESADDLLSEIKYISQKNDGTPLVDETNQPVVVAVVPDEQNQLIWLMTAVEEKNGWDWSIVDLKGAGAMVGVDFGSYLGDAVGIDELTTGLVTFHWDERQAQPDGPIDYQWYKRQLRNAKDYNLNELILNHLYFPEQAPKWLNTLKSKEEILSYFEIFFRTLMTESVKHGVTYFNVYNEPKLIGDNGKVYRPDYIYDKLYESLTPDEKILEPYLPVVWLFEVADKVRTELETHNPDMEIKLGFSNSTIHFPDGACMNQTRQVLDSLAKRNLIDYLNVHGAVKDLSEVMKYSDDQVEELFRSYQVTRSDGKIVELVIGEFIIDLKNLRSRSEVEQNEKQMAAAYKFIKNSLNSDVTKFVFFGMKDDVTWGFRSHPIDAANSKKLFYYGITSGILDYWLNQPAK